MAFGLSPKHIEDLKIESITEEQFLVLALEAAKKLGWNIGYTSETGFIAYTKFSMSSWSEEVKVRIENGIANIKSECTGSQMTDWGKNKKNIENLISSINELKSVFTPEELTQKYDELKTNLVVSEQELLNQSPTASKEKLSGFVAIFQPREGYFVTPILIDLNIGIFIMMALSGVNIMQPDNQSLINWGANLRPMTLSGEWWRLITNCFLHIGILHLLMNMYALLYIGLLLEPYLGKTRFIAAYLLTGLAASVTSLWWHDLTISAGASGAIFGMYGVFLAMLTTNIIEKSARKTLLTSIGVFVGYNLLYGMKGGVDNAAHLGGLISGLVFGYAYVPGLKKPGAQNLKYAGIGVVGVLIIVGSFIVYNKTPNDIGEYDKRIKEFVSLEEKALKVYQLPEDTPKATMLSAIREKGIYYWQENIKLVNELENLDLPERIHERNRALLSYCDLRIKSYNLLYKSVEEDTDTYKDSIQYYNNEIGRVIEGLRGE